jgi:Tfp pilus assembly protein PilN
MPPEGPLMRAVNLLPKDHAQKAVGLPSTPVLVGICAGVLVAAGLGTDFMIQSAKIATEQQKLDRLQARVQALPPAPAGPSAGATQLAGEHSARVSAVAAALANRVSWDRIFREFSLVLPDDVWLTTLTAESPVSPAGSGTPSASGAPTQFAITGRTYSHDGVARLLSRLQVIPDLEDVTLVSSTLNQVSGQSVVEFNIVAAIRTATGSPAS